MVWFFAPQLCPESSMRKIPRNPLVPWSLYSCAFEDSSSIFAAIGSHPGQTSTVVALASGPAQLSVQSFCEATASFDWSTLWSRLVSASRVGKRSVLAAVMIVTFMSGKLGFRLGVCNSQKSAWSVFCGITNLQQGQICTSAYQYSPTTQRKHTRSRGLLSSPAP